MFVDSHQHKTMLSIAWFYHSGLDLKSRL